MTHTETEYVKDEVVVAPLTEEEIHRDLKIGWFKIWMLGITIVIGGQYFSWNVALEAGFGSCLISIILIGLAYIVLMVGNAELTSAVPFSGGAYGLARLTLGFCPGFIVGMCESVEYIIYVASSAISLSTMIAQLTNTSAEMVPVYCLVFYVISATLNIVGGRTFWWTCTVLGVVSLAIIVVYCLGSLPWVSMSSNAPTKEVTGSDDTMTPNQWFVGGMSMFMKVLPLAPWFFVGVESLNLCASLVHEPSVTIPRGSIACVLTLFITAIFVACVTVSLPTGSDGGVVALSLTPLNPGFSLMFNMDINVATALSVPATFATAYGFVFAYSRVIISMARSGLFPPILMKTCGKYETPYVTVLVGSVLGYGLCIAAYFEPTFLLYLYNICIMSALMAYTSQCLGYIVFKTQFKSLQRKFESPFGIPGAVCSGLVFALAFIGVAGFQDDNQVALGSFLGIVALSTVYYYLYAKKRQHFSPEEKQIYYKIHIVMFNQRARLLATKGKKKTYMEVLKEAFHEHGIKKLSVYPKLIQEQAQQLHIIKVKKYFDGAVGSFKARGGIISSSFGFPTPRLSVVPAAPDVPTKEVPVFDEFQNSVVEPSGSPTTGRFLLPSLSPPLSRTASGANLLGLLSDVPTNDVPVFDDFHTIPNSVVEPSGSSTTGRFLLPSLSPPLSRTASGANLLGLLSK